MQEVREDLYFESELKWSFFASTRRFAVYTSSAPNGQKVGVACNMAKLCFCSNMRFIDTRWTDVIGFVVAATDFQDLCRLSSGLALSSAKETACDEFEKATGVRAEMFMVKVHLERTCDSLLAVSTRAFCWDGMSQALSMMMQRAKASLARGFCTDEIAQFTDDFSISSIVVEDFFCSIFACAQETACVAAEKSLTAEMVMERVGVSLRSVSIIAFCWAGVSQALSIAMQWAKALPARCFCAAEKAGRLSMFADAMMLDGRVWS